MGVWGGVRLTLKLRVQREALVGLGFTFSAYVKNSLVLTQQQFNTVIAAIGEGLIPVPNSDHLFFPKTLLKIWMTFCLNRNSHSANPNWNSWLL